MSIKGYWKLNGNSNDTSGNSHTGTASNITYSLSNGRLNQGAGFNGSSSKIQTTGNIGITGNAEFTISFWYKPTVQASKTNPIITFGEWSGTAYSFISVVNGYRQFGDLSLVFMSGSAAARFTTVSSTVFTNGKWHFIVITKTPGTSASTVKMLINDVNFPIYESSIPITPNIGAGTVDIGFNYFGYTNGCADEVLIDDKAWPESQSKNKLAAYKGFF